jgi:DNA-binding response OmpR family regulator
MPNNTQFRVAFAEHDSRVLADTRRFLEAMGGQVTVARSGGELRWLLGVDTGFDVIVSNYRLAAWSGLAVLLEARARGDNTPAILMSTDLLRVRPLVPPAEAILLVALPFENTTLRCAIHASLRGAVPRMPTAPPATVLSLR